MSVDLKPFCGVDESRPDLMRPFVFNGWRYATDARIIVRVPAVGEVNTVTESLTMPASAERLCNLALMRGGSVEGLHELAKFHGRGMTQPVDGMDRLERTRSRIVRLMQEGVETFFQERYLWMIFDLPDVRLHLRVCGEVFGARMGGVFFAADGLQGLLMPYHAEQGQEVLCDGRMMRRVSGWMDAEIGEEGEGDE